MKSVQVGRNLLQGKCMQVIQLEVRIREKLCRRFLPLVLSVMVMGMFIGPIGCGVRGDPRPPKGSPELGRGQPSFRKATEEFAFPIVPPVQPDSKEPSGDDIQNEE